MSAVGRAAALHAAYWQHDRWYRYAWFVWPQALAILLAGWFLAERPGQVPGEWAKPAAAGTQPSSGANPSQESPDWTTCKGSDADQAIAACTRLIASGITGVDLGWAYFNRAFNHGRKGEGPAAIADNTEAIRLKANVVYAYNNRGSWYLSGGNLDAALRDFNDAIAADSSAALPYANRGELYRQQKQPDKAITETSLAIRLDPKLLRAYWVRARAYEDKGQWAEVVADCTTVLQLDPKEVTCLDRRGICYYELDKLDLALADYNASLQLNPRSAWTLASRGAVRRDMKLYDSALSDFSEAISLNPKYTYAYANRADTYFLKQQYDLAISDANKAIELDRKWAFAFMVRGRAQMELGRIDEAADDLAAAAALAPNAWKIRYFNAIAQAKREDRMFAACPKPDRKSNIVGSMPPICMQGVQYDTSFRELNEAIRILPQYADAYSFRGALYLAIGQRSKAISDLRQALAINPNDDYARNTLRSMGQ